MRGDVIAKRDGQSFRRMTACARPHYDFTGREATAGARNAPPPAVNGWVASADATTVPVDYVSATWRVPQVPRTNTATVYFFPGLENRNAADLILQPVLGYRGADAGAEWVIYSWDCCPGNNTHHSRAIAVQPGETISGFAQGTNCNSTTGVCSNWQIRTSSANDSSTFNVTNFTESMTWVFGGVLEAYGVNSCSQYPGDNHITFNNVSVHSVAGNNLSPTWTNRLWGASPSCSASVSSTSSSATINWCVPRTCGSQCGSISDGCGGTLNRGPCTGCPSGKKCCEPNPGGGCGLCWPSGNPCP